MRGRKLIDALNLYASFRELIHRSCAHRAKTDNENIARLIFHVEGAGLAERGLSLNLVALGRKACGAYPSFPRLNLIYFISAALTSGKRCAIPLWQSIHVFSPFASKVECISTARLLCRVKSIEFRLWQFRHSSESLVFNRVHSCCANSNRLSTNFSRVLMVPKIVPHTSFDACILRAILLVQLCGT